VSEIDRLFNRRISRRRFVELGALAAGTSVLAACGGDDSSGASSGSIEDEPGDLSVLEWAGYEYPTYGGKGATGVLQPYVDQNGKPTYTFLTSDDQALGKARAGSKYDLVHPCVSYVKDWVDLGYVQEWDTSLLTNFDKLNPALVENAQIDGKQYFIPVDWGFSSVLYRGDVVEPDGEESWSLLYDDRYKGKISWWDSPIENFLIWGYTIGQFDAYDWDNWTDEVLEDATKYLIEKKELVRTMWSSETELNNDVANGNVWIAYSWSSSYKTARDAKLDVVFADPKEGRLSWNCGFVLGKDTENFHHAHAYVDQWIGAASAGWMIPNYYYGHTNTEVDTSSVDPELVEVFKLDDPTALEEPKAHIERYVPDRRRFARAWDEVKAT
jgi:spermidine/putrescine transport system substrate-binding protein